jgi:hypothetical protein
MSKIIVNLVHYPFYLLCQLFNKLINVNYLCTFYSLF